MQEFLKDININKKKVLFFSPSFTDKAGIANYCRILIKEINPVFQIDHHIIGNRPENSSFFRRCIYPTYDTVMLIYKLFRYSYDVIHLNPSTTKYSIAKDSFYVFILSFFSYSSKIVVFFRGCDESIIQRFKKSAFLKKLFNRYYNKLGKILVLSTSFKQQLIELGIKEEKILVTTTLYKKSINNFWENKKRENGITNILFMSRFAKAKGIDIVCGVLKLLVDNGYRKILFVFAGDGPEIDNLHSFINDNQLNKFVSLPGYIIGKLKDRVLAEGDIYILPSKTEGLPNAILEAMGAGLVVISKPVGGIPEVVEDGLNGFLHDSDDPVVYFNSVKRLIEEKELLIDIQKRNRKKAEDNYEASIVIKNIENLYHEVANSNK